MVTMTPQHLPPLPALLETARVVSVPLRVRFRGVEHREALLFRGPAGWGEFCPFLEYGPAESSRWLACAIEAAFAGFPAPLREEVPVNATVPAVAPERVAEVLERFPGEVREVKVKVAERGQGLEDDVARVRAVRRAAPRAVLKMDANGGWDHGEALRAARALAEFEPAYLEQPVAGIEGLARLREALCRDGIEVPIAADESVRKEEDPVRVARAGAADLIVVKAPPLGGVRAALEVIERAGLPAVVSSALETSVGMSAGLALAAALPELPHACGLGTASLLTADLVAEPLTPRDGRLPVVRAEPEPELLERHAASPERHEWWLRRLTAAYGELAGQQPDSPR
nr:o-succinylbenzoate synthase [Rothia halotolerans]